MPYLVNDDPLPADGKERLQSPAERERFDDTTKCILCAACTTSCPSFWANGKYVGPAAIVNAHRFIYDSRDQGGRGTPEGVERAVWRLALPHGVQLHRGLPARNSYHPGDCRGQAHPS